MSNIIVVLISTWTCTLIIRTEDTLLLSIGGTTALVLLILLNYFSSLVNG